VAEFVYTPYVFISDIFPVHVYNCCWLSEDKGSFILHEVGVDAKNLVKGFYGQELKHHKLCDKPLRQYRVKVINKETKNVENGGTVGGKKKKKRQLNLG
jgi:hypothetical protein